MDPVSPDSSLDRRDSPAHTAGAVAHDINNLLQVILGCCEKLQADSALSSGHREEIAHIVVAAEHATALTSQVQARGGTPRAERRVIDLRRALQRLEGLLQRIVGDTVTFDVRLPPDGTSIHMSEGDLAQVLVNLAVNAREAMDDSGRFSITSSLTVAGDGLDVAATPSPHGYVRLDVVDSGAGMSAAVRERAFERFFTTKAGEGSGHGLATVQAIIHRHAGSITVHSDPGHGTHFTILIPLAGSAPVVDVAAPVARAREGELVLVIDDEPMAREVMVGFLQGLGYRTAESGSGTDALATLSDASQRADLLLADVTMPDMTGIEFARRVRDAGWSTPMLLVSGDTADAVRAAAGSSIPFLQKPFTTRDLGAAVRQLLDGARAPGLTSATPRQSTLMDGGLVDQLPAPVFVLQRGRFAYVNGALTALMALPANELLGRSTLERVHPDDRSVFPAQPLEPAGAAPTSSTQVRVRCGDGCERSLVLTTVPVTYGGAPALLGVASDVSVQPDALTLAVRMAALGRLAGGIAHDYNNLLLVIGGHIERLQAALPPGEAVRSDVDAIAAAAARAATLTDNLLSFGRRQLLAPEVQDLGALVEAMATELRRRVDPAIELRIERGASVPAIEADRSRLREVLWHLVENARDAMPGGGTLTLAIDAIEVDEALHSRWTFLARGGAFVRLRVVDTGSGMEPEVAAHVFEPFFTTKGKGRGAGMGLASVYGIVKQSGGYVFAERAGERGTCMTVLLPPAAARQGVPVTGREPSHAARDVGRAPNRILLVEDDPGVREVLVDVLNGRGFHVTATSTAEEALEQAGDGSFDLLLSDIDLPGMNGARLAAALLESQPALRIILMSGYPDDGTIDGELGSRPTFLSKPFTSKVLLESVGHVLSQPDGSPGEGK